MIKGKLFMGKIFGAILATVVISPINIGPIKFNFSFSCIVSQES
jgi:hypothetical protein